MTEDTALKILRNLDAIVGGITVISCLLAAWMGIDIMRGRK